VPHHPLKASDLEVGAPFWCLTNSVWRETDRPRNEVLRAPPPVKGPHKGGSTDLECVSSAVAQAISPCPFDLRDL
jgi:hypothetical protein